MPLARNASGLLRRAAGFIASCCCTKWLCNPATQDCTQDPSGPYTSEKECNEKCKRYSCDTSSYTCVPDPAGPYENLAECAAICKPDKYYCCGPASDPDDRDCYNAPCGGGFDQYGVYDTPEECDDKCKLTHYICDTSTYTCTEDPTGPYTDPQECADNCKDTQYYCCEDASGVKTCRQGGCEAYGENQVGGPYIDDIECADDCKTLYYCCRDASGARSCYPNQCPSGTTTVGVYTDETECNDKCPVYYVCVQKTPYPVDGYECVAFNDAIDPSLILDSYETPDCDGQCPPDPVYFCCEDASGDKDCYKYGCPPDRTEAGGPYSTPRECSTDCGVKYYCCEDSEGNKTCRDDECEYYGENEVGGPYDTKDLCEPECEKYYCCEDSSGERNCYKGNCPPGTEEKGGPYDDDVACKEAACAKVYWYCASTDKCESSDSGPYESEDACLDGAPEDCKTKYSCVTDDDGKTFCVESPDGEFDEDTCGGNCPKREYWRCVSKILCESYDVDPGGTTYPTAGSCLAQAPEDCRDESQKYACVNGDCVPDANGVYDEPTCGDQCGGGFVGGCCTDYGFASVSREQCAAWGGTFYEPGEVFDQTCGCDCALAGNYVEQQDDVVGTCTNSSGGNTLYAADARVWIGEVQGVNCQFVNCGPLQPYVEKGASPIGWVETAFASVAESTLTPTGQCCIGQTRVYKDRYSAFVYNCKTKKLEEVVVLSETSSVEGTDEGELCPAFLGGGPVPSPATPTINVLGRKPTCAAREAPNPLP